MRGRNSSRSGIIAEESSTDPPWIQTTTGPAGWPASLQWRRTPVGRTISGRAEPLLQRARVPRHRVRAHPVHDRDEQVQRERADLAVVDDLGGLGEIHEPDDRGERRVLEQHDELRDQRGDHVLERLGQHDVTHALRAAEPDRGGRLHLSSRHRLYSRPHDLAEISRLEDDEGGESDAELGDRGLQHDGDDEPHPEDHHHEGNAAEELDVEHGGHANPPLGREPSEADDEPEQEAQHDGRDGEAQRAPHEGSDPDEALDDQEGQVAPDDVEARDHRRARRPPAVMRPGIAVRRSTQPITEAKKRHSTRYMTVPAVSASMAFAVYVSIWRVWNVSSATLMVSATDEFLSRFSDSLVAGGMMSRRATGR